MFGFDIAIQVLKDIAQRSDNPDVHCRINSFVVLDQLSDLSKPDYNKTDRDYEVGHAWNRYLSSTDTKMHDMVLFVMQKYCYRKALNNKERCIKLLIGVAQSEKCVGCPENYTKTKDEVDIQNENMVWDVLDQFRSYRQYDVMYEGETEYQTILALPEQIKCLKDEGKITKCKDCAIDLDCMIEERKAQVQCLMTCIGDKRIKTLEISICGCAVSSNNFNTKPTDQDSDYATIKCPSCFQAA